MAAPIQVAILGFSAFERNALAAHIKIAAARSPAYTVVLAIDDAMFVIADADQAGAIELLRELDRLLRQRELPNSLPMPLELPSAPGAPRRLEPMPTDPPARRADDRPPAETVARRRGRPPPVLPLRRALLVDDSEVALHFLRRRLEPYAIDADLAHDSSEALQRLAAQAYGIVFLDVDLGEGSELDGLVLCKRIKARQTTLVGRPPLLVLVSAFHDGVHQARGTLAGADAYLAKPLDRAALDRLLTGIGLPRTDKTPG